MEGMATKTRIAKGDAGLVRLDVARQRCIRSIKARPARR